MPNNLEKILNNKAFSDLDRNLIKKSFEFARIAHQNQKRLSGDDYIEHTLYVAGMLNELGLDATTIASGLLHDTLEDTEITVTDLEKEFGSDIAFLVKGVTKLSNIDYSSKPHSRTGKVDLNRYNDSLKKMFLAMAEDIRIIIIKLADRYHNMTTLNFLPKEDQTRIAQETLDIYAPIAARLGMGKLKGQLEDLAFSYVYPEDYKELIKNIGEKYEDRLEYISKICPIIKHRLTSAGVKVLDLHSRAKHYWSLYQKLKKEDEDIEKIFDLVAIRIIVPDISSCYEALGVIHRHYKPVPGRIKDYISLPKPNGYQSLHTTIFCEKGRVVEIQIRTPEMHQHAENGIAAHWAYSEKGKTETIKADLKETSWVKQLKKFVEGMRLGEDLNELKVDFFKNRIFAFTPKGEVKDLPEGATPIDFAYAIHTELGDSTQGAKVNGRMVTLSHELHNGDIVEIIKKKNGKPSFDWLKIVKTSEARRRIRSKFNKISK